METSHESLAGTGVPGTREAARGRLVVALDVADAHAAWELVEDLGDAASFFKVGLELWAAGGVEVARELVARGAEVFIDLKLCDIPETMERAVRNLVGLGARFLTVHEPPSSVQGAARGCGSGSLQLLGVTYLTSMTEEEVRLVHGIEAGRSVEDATAAKARRLLAAGCAGLVCSPLEVATLRTACPEAVLVTPGIRPAGAGRADQVRVATPRQAAAAGADYLVVGRPVRDAGDRRAALEALIDDAWAGFQAR